jgi:RecG-like helicase
MYMFYSNECNDDWSDQLYWISALIDESDKLHWTDQVVALTDQIKTFVVVHIKQFVMTFKSLSVMENEENEEIFDVI